MAWRILPAREACLQARIFPEGGLLRAFLIYLFASGPPAAGRGREEAGRSGRIAQAMAKRVGAGWLHEELNLGAGIRVVRKGRMSAIRISRLEPQWAQASCGLPGFSSAGSSRASAGGASGFGSPMSWRARSTRPSRPRLASSP